MIRVRQIKIEVNKDSYDYLRKKVLTKLKISSDDLKEMIIVKKSIDARDKNNVLYVYEVNIELNDDSKKDTILKKTDVSLVEDIVEKEIIPGRVLLANRPVVVGSGPCGLFCALTLAENGYKPIIIERGEKVEEREKTVEKFWNEGILNKESNVCFGEGGAGTFSDGKLNTLINDKEGRIKKI